MNNDLPTELVRLQEEVKELKARIRKLEKANTVIVSELAQLKDVLIRLISRL